MCVFNFSAPDSPTTLVLRHVPLPLTCGMFDGTIITDPSLLEEELLTTHVTVVSTAEGKVRGDSNSLGRNFVCCCASAAGLRCCIVSTQFSTTVFASKKQQFLVAFGLRLRRCAEFTNLGEAAHQESS